MSVLDHVLGGAGHGSLVKDAGIVGEEGGVVICWSPCGMVRYLLPFNWQALPYIIIKSTFQSNGGVALASCSTDIINKAY